MAQYHIVKYQWGRLVEKGFAFKVVEIIGIEVVF